MRWGVLLSTVVINTKGKMRKKLFNFYFNFLKRQIFFVNTISILRWYIIFGLNDLGKEILHNGFMIYFTPIFGINRV